jgi:hypothetical protein
MRLGRSLDPIARQPQPLSQRFWIGAAFIMRCPIRPTARRGVTLHGPPQTKHRTPLPLQAFTNACVGNVEFQADH